MKVLVIPDIHGSWVNIIPYIKAHKDEVDYVVTLGDYTDDWDEDVNGQPMVDGFNELVSMARAEPDKFKICIGNHDNCYISERRDGDSCSGTHHQYREMYSEMFEDNIDLLHAAVLIDGVLFSHAGVSQFWYNKICATYNEKHKFDKVPKEVMDRYIELEDSLRLGAINDKYFNGEVFSLVYPKDEEHKAKIERYHKIRNELQEESNKLFYEMKDKYKYEKIPSYRFHVDRLNMMFRECHHLLDFSGWESSGNSSGESCVWIRPPALLRDNWPEGLKCQVVGHTEMGLKRLKYRTHKLIVCDNRQHDCAFVLDTENIGDGFETVLYESKKNALKKLGIKDRLYLELLGIL